MLDLFLKVLQKLYFNNSRVYSREKLIVGDKLKIWGTIVKSKGLKNVIKITSNFGILKNANTRCIPLKMMKNQMF
jgi:hypothetical protein